MICIFLTKVFSLTLTTIKSILAKLIEEKIMAQELIKNLLD